MRPRRAAAPAAADRRAALSRARWQAPRTRRLAATRRAPHAGSEAPRCERAGKEGARVVGLTMLPRPAAAVAGLAALCALRLFFVSSLSLWFVGCWLLYL